MRWPINDAEIIQSVVLVHEGGFMNDPADAGGATNFGITQADLAAWRRHAVTVEDVRNMPQSEAVAIYTKKYIAEPGFDTIADLCIRTAAVDCGVLFGPKTAIIALQGIAGVLQDGALGPGTAAAIAAVEPRKAVNALSVWRVKRHAVRVQADPGQVKFLLGWINRACDFIE